MKKNNEIKTNPFANRLDGLVAKMKEQRLDTVLVYNQANVRSLTGIDCDNACLAVSLVKGKGKAALESEPSIVFYTDFRYVPMIHRTAPWLQVGEMAKMKFGGLRIGCEFTMSHARFEGLAKKHRKAKFIDITRDLAELRSVKTAWEIERLREAEALNDKIYKAAVKQFRAGMSEIEMARIIQHLQLDRGQGEAFETIICVGPNAAECHHVPDNTVWDGKAPLLIDMGVKLNGYCSDMTRNLVTKEAKKDPEYSKIYDLVLQANLKAIAAAKPGLTTGELDAVARDFLTEQGYGAEFGHSLGHGVGIEIHEAPGVAKNQTTVLKPGMLITIEPGVYIEDRLGVRIEDLILITEDGCEVLSSSAK